jgi:hypothetical protein
MYRDILLSPDATLALVKHHQRDAERYRVARTVHTTRFLWPGRFLALSSPLQCLKGVTCYEQY